MSDILNITRQAYPHYEQALREPDLNTLVHLSHLYKVSLDELIAGNIHPDEVRESMPVYKYRLGETSDHKWSICLTEQDLNLLEKFRNASENTSINTRIFDKVLKNLQNIIVRLILSNCWPTAQLSAVFYFSVLLIIQSESVMDGDHRFFRIFLINQNRDPDF